MINVSIIGAGKIAEEHIKAFSSFKNIKIVGIFSRTKSKAIKLKKKYKIFCVYDSISSLRVESKTDIVVVAVNLESIFSIYQEVLKYDWVCLLEKPLGLNFAQAKKIISECKYPKKVFVGLNRYSYSTSKRVIDFLKKDSSKRVIYLFDQQNTKKIEKNIIKKNWMYCNSIHLVDYCRFLARGKLSSIQLVNKIDKLNFTKILKFSSGDKVFYTSIWNKPGPWSIKISTKKYFLDLINLESLYVTDNFNKKNKVSLNFFDKKFKPGFYQQAKEIKNFIYQKVYPNLPNIKDAYKTMELVKKIYKRK